MSQYEPDERIADQIRLLIPDHGGGDETEDYQLALAYLLMATDYDIVNFYHLKAYGFIVGDEIGRESVTVSDVKDYLGHTLQSKTSTKAVAQQLLQKMHLFYIHVRLGGDHDHSPAWWTDKLGVGHVLVAHDVDLLAEVQAGLIYVTETLAPTKDGLFEFLSAEGKNKRASKSTVDKVWSWIMDAGVEFGAQAKLPGYADIPMPGAVFEDIRHQWPIDSPHFKENVIAAGPVVVDPAIGAPKAEKPNWSKFA
jgi:hypothetical protein